MIVHWSTGDAEQFMSEEILTKLGGIVSRHPWFQARTKLVVALLEKMGVHPPALVLDAGCGWGLNLEALQRRGYRTVGLDISRRSLERLDRPGLELIEADLTQPLPPDVEAFDAVVAFDVIEHVDDDRAAVATLARLTKPGGVTVVGVPALPDLYSDFDVVLGHRRRYLPDTLRQAFAGSNLQLEHLLWWGSWMPRLLRWQRERLRTPADEAPHQTYQRHLALPPWPSPVLLRLAFAADQRWTLRDKSRIGTSLFALARRPEDGGP